MTRYLAWMVVGALLGLPVGYMLEVSTDHFHHSFWDWLTIACILPSNGQPLDQFMTFPGWMGWGVVAGIGIAALTGEAPTKLR